MSGKYHSFKLALSGNVHRADGSESQDAYALDLSDDFVLALVSDGVGSCPDARVGAIFITQALRRLMRGHQVTLMELSEKLTPEVFGERLMAWLNRELPAELTRAACYLGGEVTHTKPMLERFLCATVLGFVMLPPTTVAFACGDGVLLVNQEWSELRAVRDNAPALPAHHAAGSENRTGLLKVVLAGESDALQSVAIGTDGAVDLIAASRQRLLADASGMHAGSAVEENLLIPGGNSVFPYDDATLVGVVRRASPASAPPPQPVPTCAGVGV
jgi:hypothetical protein